MIKPIFGVLAVSAALTLSLAGCSGEEKGTSSTGRISPFVSLQPEALTSSVSRAGSEPNIAASDLSLKLVSEDGSINRTFSSVNDFPTDEKFKVGRYTLSAYYGSSERQRDARGGEGVLRDPVLKRRTGCKSLF